jgi:hypothetical protein
MFHGIGFHGIGLILLVTIAAILSDSAGWRWAARGGLVLYVCWAGWGFVESCCDKGRLVVPVLLALFAAIILESRRGAGRW